MAQEEDTTFWAAGESGGVGPGAAGREEKADAKSFHRTPPPGAELEGPLPFGPLGVREQAFPDGSEGVESAS